MTLHEFPKFYIAVSVFPVLRHALDIVFPVLRHALDIVFPVLRHALDIAIYLNEVCIDRKSYMYHVVEAILMSTNYIMILWRKPKLTSYTIPVSLL